MRAWFAGPGRAAFTWYLSPLPTAPDLEGRLRDHGASEDLTEPEHAAMVLDREPPSSHAEFEVRPVEGFEDFCASQDTFDMAFDRWVRDLETQTPTEIVEE